MKYQAKVQAHLCDLEGFKTKFKNLHWSAVHLTMHRVIDELLDELGDYQDTIAETSMGYLGIQFPPDFLSGTVIMSDNPEGTLNTLIGKVNGFYALIKMEDSMQGIVNAINDFQEKLLKYNYLFRLAHKDGSINLSTVGKSKLSSMIEE
jgi:DNA-binding ferritin-like protein